MRYKILVISDIDILKNFSIEQLKSNFKDVDMILACGDLSNSYLDYLVSALDKTLIYVNGNHIYESSYDISYLTCIDGKSTKYKGLKIAGFDGCRVYSYKKHQYTEGEMTFKVMKNIFSFVIRKPDIIISHAPPRHINDKEDYVHRGFRVFRKLIKWFKPILWIHGHIHLSSHLEEKETVVDNTRVINAYGYKIIEFEK